MMKKRFGKEKISIKSIGSTRFYFGLFVGILTAFTLSYLFNYSREILRTLTSSSADLMILDQNELHFYNYFYASISAVLGLSITLWIWLHQVPSKKRMSTIYSQVARTNSYLFFWLILMLIARFGTLLVFILFSRSSYDNQLKLYEDFGIIFLLLPLVVFLYNWISIRRVYHVGTWMAISFFVCILGTITLYNFTSLDQEIINKAYFKHFEEEHQFVDMKLEYARANYGLEFNSETIEALKKYRTESSYNQVAILKSAFSSNKPVSLDTIILQIIVVRNVKDQGWCLYDKNSINFWPYAFPSDIKKQIYLNLSDSAKTYELYQLLLEEINLVNTPKIEWQDYLNSSRIERRRISFAEWMTPKVLIYQLIDVRDSLLKIDKFESYSKMLPEICLSE
ncbi:MAG: hypothetical protein H6579_09270 [Chitinophagales bacterium]|nr:hypothetical protein [Chitinophagales bacterium]